MGATPSLAAALIQAGLLMLLVLLGQQVAVRHLPVESIPGVLRGRVTKCNLLRPFLLVAAAGVAGAGLVIQLVG
jgi:hypothetical protein